MAVLHFLRWVTRRGGERTQSCHVALSPHSNDSGDVDALRILNVCRGGVEGTFVRGPAPWASTHVQSAVHSLQVDVDVCVYGDRGNKNSHSPTMSQGVSHHDVLFQPAPVAAYWMIRIEREGHVTCDN